MKKILMLGLAVFYCSFAGAKPEPKYNENPRFKEVPWEESKQALPNFPEKDSDQWQDFYVNEKFKNTALLNLGSINVIPEDYTIRYVLNVRSLSGVDNVSAEGVRCTDRLNKIFAFGDTINQKWIENRRANWASIDVDDAVRLQIRKIFCAQGTPKNREEAITRFMKEAPKSSRPRTGINSSENIL